MLKPKQIKQALAARDMALTLGNYSDDRMRIEHKPGQQNSNTGACGEIRSATSQTSPAPTPHELAVWWIDFKVLNVVWREHDDAVVVFYRPGPWEWHLKRKVAALLLPGSGL